MLKQSTWTAFLASVFLLQIASFGFTSDAEGQAGDGTGTEFELVTEFRNLSAGESGGIFPFGNAITFVGNDVLVGSARTFDVPCQSKRAVDGTHFITFGCTALGEVTLFDSTSGRVIRTINNPSPEVVDQTICDSPEILVDPQNNCLGERSADALRDDFGAAVASFGDDKFIVGAPSDNTFGCSTPFNCRTGLVYVYGANGGLLHTLKAPAPGSDDLFGSSVATVGNNILVGAPGADDHHGAVFMFDGTTGALLLELHTPDPQITLNRFGQSVAGLGDDTIVVGDPRFDTNRTLFDVGRVYLFDAKTGELIRKIFSPTPKFSLFGQSVIALGDDEFAVTAPNFSDSSSIEFSGRVFLYDKTGSPAGVIANPDPAGFDRFGCQQGNCVGRIGENILVGSPAGFGGGKNTLYMFGDGEVKLFKNPSPEPTDTCVFGGPLAVQGHKFAVVDTCDKNGMVAPAPRGSVFVYSSEPRLKGSVVSLEDEELPLKRVLVELIHDGGVEMTQTDDMGNYTIPLPDGVSTGQLRVTLEHEESLLTVLDLDTPVDEAAYIETDDIDIETETRGDFKFAGGFVTLNETLIISDASTNATDLTDFTSLASVYVHTLEFLEWVQEKLLLDVEGLEIRSRECDRMEPNFFRVSTVRINLCNRTARSLAEGLDTTTVVRDGEKIDIPVNESAFLTLGHEVGHYIEYLSPIGGPKDLIDNPPGNNNHDGYKNPDSSDAVTEGFATFMSAVMNLELHSFPPIWGPISHFALVNLDQTILVPGAIFPFAAPLCNLQYVNVAEELAVATPSLGLVR